MLRAAQRHIDALALPQGVFDQGAGVGLVLHADIDEDTRSIPPQHRLQQLLPHGAVDAIKICAQMTVCFFQPRVARAQLLQRAVTLRHVIGDQLGHRFAVNGNGFPLQLPDRAVRQKQEGIAVVRFDAAAGRQIAVLELLVKPAGILHARAEGRVGDLLHAAVHQARQPIRQTDADAVRQQVQPFADGERR